MSESQERFELLEKLKAEAAKLLRLPVDHQKVTLLAGLKLEHTRQLELLVGGERINPNELLAVSEAIEKLTPALPPAQIKVEIVDGVVGIYKCQHCGKQNHLEPGTYTPAPDWRDKAPKVIDGKAEEVTHAAPDSISDEKRTTSHGNAIAGPSKEASRSLPPPLNPRWSDDPPDKQYAKAVDFTAGVNGFIKHSPWHGSAPMLGAVVRRHPLPGEPDHRPAPTANGKDPRLG